MSNLYNEFVKEYENKSNGSREYLKKLGFSEKDIDDMVYVYDLSKNIIYRPDSDYYNGAKGQASEMFYKFLEHKYKTLSNDEDMEFNIIVDEIKIISNYINMLEDFIGDEYEYCEAIKVDVDVDIYYYVIRFKNSKEEEYQYVCIDFKHDYELDYEPSEYEKRCFEVYS